MDMSRDQLNEGEMLLIPHAQRSLTDPVAYGWRREGEWFVGLVCWKNGNSLRVIEQGRERA